MSLKTEEKDSLKQKVISVAFDTMAGLCDNNEVGFCLINGNACDYDNACGNMQMFIDETNKL